MCNYKETEVIEKGVEEKCQRPKKSQNTEPKYKIYRFEPTQDFNEFLL